MTVTKETVAAWLAAYVRAWEVYDPDTIGDLFTEDATYAYHPFEEPVRGRLAIVASWLENKDAPGTYEGRYDPVAIQGDLAVANGRSRYFKDASKAELVREYDNLFSSNSTSRVGVNRFASGTCSAGAKKSRPRHGATFRLAGPSFTPCRFSP